MSWRRNGLRCGLVLGTLAGVSRRRYLARGVPGGWRIWDNKARRWWGDHYEVQPDELVAELNTGHDPDRLTALLKRFRALRR
jgi:hypothetical protein